jgi:hypothetical protein
MPVFTLKTPPLLHYAEKQMSYKYFSGCPVDLNIVHVWLHGGQVTRPETDSTWEKSSVSVSTLLQHYILTSSRLFSPAAELCASAADWE